MSAQINWRIEKAKVEYLCSVIEPEARRKLGNSEAAKDCAVVFLEQVYPMVEAEPWPLSEAVQARLAVAAHRCAETEARRLRRLRSREMFADDLDGGTISGITPEFASGDLGPDARAMISDTICALKRDVLRRSRCYGSMFDSVFLLEKTPSELAREIGKSQQAVDRSVRRLRAQVANVVAEAVFADLDIDSLLNMIDRRGYGRQRWRHRP